MPVAGDMIIDGNGYIWALLPRGHGLLVYDPAGTPEDISDDRYLRLQVEDTEGHVMNNLFSMLRTWKEISGLEPIGTGSLL